ncbi:MAG: alginate lyase family protein [Candidatus Marinimicrobia bacterium]|nr:alginate lyase family protein [Candidatus Neomarinimicrobiota bacterium]
MRVTGKTSLKFVSICFVGLLTLALIQGCANPKPIGFDNRTLKLQIEVASIDRDRILHSADSYMLETPITVTAASCERSLGGVHDFYSEGDYWWPNLDNPDAPYEKRDGLTNPDNFTDHRKAMRRMSIQVANLAAAYKLSGEQKYADHAAEHLKAWFVSEDSKMNPHMRFAQAITNVVPGRGVGLIDGIHLVEPARAVSIIEDSGALTSTELNAVKDWYADFLTWMTTHEYGIDERDRKNNHGTCWVMQAAEFASLTGNEQVLAYCRERYKTVLLPNQMSSDGGFFMELARTKPYGYSLFNIDAMAMVCHILSTPADNLWDYSLDDGRNMTLGMTFIVPFIADKSTWPLEPDIMYWDQWPVRHPSLLFAGMAYKNQSYLSLWKTLKPLPETEEGLRNFPIREPLLWL